MCDGHHRLRVNVSADYGVVWQLSRAFSVAEQFDFENFRQPAIGYLSEVDQYSASMLSAPATAGPAALTTAANFLGQKSESNRITGDPSPSPKCVMSQCVAEGCGAGASGAELAAAGGAGTPDF